MRSFTRRATTLVAAGMLTAMMATAAVAAESTTTQSIEAGTLSASLADLSLGNVTYSHTDQTSTGTLALTADDSTGSGDGWKVSVVSSAFVYHDGTALDPTHDLAASKFSLTSAAAPVSTAGQAVDTTNGPKAATTTGTLEAARTVISAGVGYGQGTYTQDLGVSLAIPGQSRAGTYTGTVTTTATAGPVA